MNQSLWGEFKENSQFPIKPSEVSLPKQKADKLKKLKKAAIYFQARVIEKIQELKLKNPLITQTIEVMYQTEMLQSLMDTYATKTGLSKYDLNPYQLIPQVEFAPENSANLTEVYEDKFIKPFWFIPPIDTDFTKGKPECHPKINKELCHESIKKVICGLLKVEGFSDVSHNALLMFTEAVVEHIKNILLHVKDVQINESNDKSCKIDILTLENGYKSLTNDSLVSIHDYFKNKVINKNLMEIEEFKEFYKEYDKLMKESQDIQKSTFNEEDYLQLLDMTSTCQTNDISNVNLLNLLENDNFGSSSLKDLFGGDFIDMGDTRKTSAGPSFKE